MPESDSSSEAPTVKRVDNDDLYRRSTQYRYWSFSASKLEDLRVLANKKGASETERKISQLDSSETNLLSGHGFPFVTIQEEAKIITYYARKCRDLANFFRLPSQARATAVMYLYKFYLSYSVMLYHPQHIMYTCLFLAAKVENSFIGINNFSKAIPKTTPESILQYEYLVLQTLRFSLRCHHAYQPLYGFFLDIQDRLPKVEIRRLRKSCDSARVLIDELLFTDAPFLYTPPQIALACLWKIDSILVERYVAKKVGLKRKKKQETMSEEPEESEITEKEPDTAAEEEEVSGPQKAYNRLIETIENCAAMIDSAATNPTIEEAKHISSKVRFCLEPSRYARRLLKKAKQTSAESEKRPLDSSDDSSAKRAKTA